MSDTQEAGKNITETQIYDVLKECYDPEIPVNIVDLGLIYEVKVLDDQVALKMTLTTPGCGMAGYIADMVRERLLGLPGIKGADVHLTWEPRWHPSMMSAEARKVLGMS
jgi:metal-sulfur cluster biosynthetic enzyme